MRKTCDRCGAEVESPLRTLCKKCWYELEDELGYPRTPYVTNADRIRAMSDEELADWYFDKFFPFVPYCSILDECPEHDDCKICLLNWLKQECDRCVT